MATTRLMPLHAGKGRTVADALGRTTEYIENPSKTDGGEWVSAYECDPDIADQEFLFSKRQYRSITGRDQGDSDVIAYHLRQSFKPGEIDPATANRIGCELAMSLTKGRHAFVVCTHTDRRHIHNHVVINSTSLDCTRKFRNFWRSSFAIRRISDLLCLQNGLSVIEKPKPSRGSYGTWLGEGKPLPLRVQLERLMDDVLAGGCMDFDSFLAALREKGVEIKRGKHLAFKLPGGKRFIRCDSLDAEYTEDALRKRLSGRATTKEKPSLLIDIQAKLHEGKGAGYVRWANRFNLKEMSKTLLYLQENDLLNFSDLSEKCKAASARYHNLADKTKANSARMKEISELQKAIGTYGKTRDIYAQYRGMPPKKRAAFYEEHRGAIVSCEAAKKLFDSLGLKKLPAIHALRQEYAALESENKRLYPQQKQAKADMMELLTAKSNVERIMGMDRKKNDVRREKSR